MSAHFTYTLQAFQKSELCQLWSAGTCVEIPELKPTATKRGGGGRGAFSLDLFRGKYNVKYSGINQIFYVMVLRDVGEIWCQ